MTLPTQIAQAAYSDALIELYELDTTPLTAVYGVADAGAAVYCWTPGTIGDAAVYYGGVEYVPLPIEGSQFEWNGQGKLPVPQIAISNIGNLVSALVLQFSDCLGAQVTRYRVFQRFLDGQPDADPSAYFEPDIYIVNRKVSQTKTAVTFELRALMDAQGVQLPRRQVICNTCTHTYRVWTSNGFVYGSCPYTGSAYFDLAGNSTDSIGDVCGKQYRDCVLRFNAAPLPTRAFPGVAITPT